MKKAYSKAEAMKVSFNSKEQVAAACQYDVDEATNGTKFIGTPIGDLCGVFDGYGSGDQYGNETMSMCYILDDGTSPYMEAQYEI